MIIDWLLSCAVLSNGIMICILAAKNTKLRLRVEELESKRFILYSQK